MRKFLRGNDAELVSDTATHLHSKVEAKSQFFGFNILGGPMWIEQLQNAGSSFLNSVLITASHPLKDHAGCMVCLEVTTPEQPKNLCEIIRDKSVARRIVFRSNLRDLPPGKVSEA